MIKKTEKRMMTGNEKSTFFVNFAEKKQVKAHQSIHLTQTKTNRIMSKTIELQIEKSRGLIDGLRKHLRQGVGGGVNDQEIDQMEQALKELEAANEECDRLRAELSPKVKHMNEVLTTVKTAYADKKKTLKGYYPQEQWAEYGVPDKR